LFAIDVVKMSEAHTAYMTFKLFKDEIEKTKIKCPKVKENLRLLCC